VLRDLYDGPALARQMSYLLAIALIAPLVAPVIGGQIVAHAGWRFVFVALCAFGAVAAAAIVLTVPETLPNALRRKADLGALGVFAARMFQDPAQVRLIVCNAGMSAALFAYLGSASELYMGEYGLSSQTFAFAFCSVVGALALGAFASARAVSRLGPERALRVFAATAFAGALVVLGVAVSGAGGLFAIVAALMAFFLSMNGVNANASALLMQRYAHAAGAASAVLGATQFIAGAAVTFLLSRLDAAPLGMALAMFAGASAVAAAALARAR
jgi:DHA1 family bicyclomycin/chloramphenicol resistance-like MFS transporter